MALEGVGHLSVLDDGGEGKEAERAKERERVRAFLHWTQVAGEKYGVRNYAGN